MSLLELKERGLIKRINNLEDQLASAINEMQIAEQAHVCQEIIEGWEGVCSNVRKQIIHTKDALVAVENELYGTTSARMN